MPLKRTPLSFSRVAVCTILLALQPGCGGINPPDWKKVLEAVPPNGARAATTAPPTSQHVVVYLDTSASMAGYVSKDRSGQTVFSRTLQELRNLTTILSPPLDVLVRHVDARVGPPQGDSDLTLASVNAGTFAGRETDLAGAIGEFERPVVPPPPAPKAEEGQGDGEPPAPPPPARFHILVTDGVQSTSRQGPNLTCVAGSDQVCVRKKIMTLLDKGWGASVIALRSEFGGKIYSEVSRAAIPYETRRADPRTFRPFYVYVFSPDRAALGGLVDVLKERLRPLAAADDSLRELSLSLPYAAGHARAEAAIPKGKSGALELSKAREENPARLTLRVDLDTETSGPEAFDVKVEVPWSSHARYVGTPQERAELVAWSVVPVYPPEGAGGAAAESRRVPELKVTGQTADAEGRAVLQLTAQWPRGTGEAGWRVYRLEGRLSLDRQTPAWVQQWSTNLDTTAEAGNKTLNLESVLLGLWRNAVLRDQVVAEVYLRIGPR